MFTQLFGVVLFIVCLFHRQVADKIQFTPQGSTKVYNVHLSETAFKGEELIHFQREVARILEEEFMFPIFAQFVGTVYEGAQLICKEHNFNQPIDAKWLKPKSRSTRKRTSKFRKFTSSKRKSESASVTATTRPTKSEVVQFTIAVTEYLKSCTTYIDGAKIQYYRPKRQRQQLRWMAACLDKGLDQTSTEIRQTTFNIFFHNDHATTSLTNMLYIDPSKLPIQYVTKRGKSVEARSKRHKSRVPRLIYTWLLNRALADDSGQFCLDRDAHWEDWIVVLPYDEEAATLAEKNCHSLVTAGGKKVGGAEVKDGTESVQTASDEVKAARGAEVKDGTESVQTASDEVKAAKAKAAKEEAAEEKAAEEKAAEEARQLYYSHLKQMAWEWVLQEPMVGQELKMLQIMQAFEGGGRVKIVVTDSLHNVDVVSFHGKKLEDEKVTDSLHNVDVLSLHDKKLEDEKATDSLHNVDVQSLHDKKLEDEKVKLCKEVMTFGQGSLNFSKTPGCEKESIFAFPVLYSYSWERKTVNVKVIRRWPDEYSRKVKSIMAMVSSDFVNISTRQKISWREWLQPTFR